MNNHRMMYSGRGFREWEIGDIDIIKHDGTYHLFHLVLPNHDYIAHAESRDCINWNRVKNALFVGDPGEWDDDMLWTMNVARREDGGFEMFYTGLSQKENGFYQRIGHAVSDDLYNWNKDTSPPYPIDSAGPYYESPDNNARQWVSFRDPFLYRDEEGKRFLLVCARTTRGIISRRGCIGLLQLDGENVVYEPPILLPYVYDDVECPAIVQLKDRYYLIGSIREDIKVHYWCADEFQGEYFTFADNILLPQGNYAARVSQDDGRILLYSFFVAGIEVETANRYFCPPKELDSDDSGRLILRSFSNWKKKAADHLPQAEFPPLEPFLDNPLAELQQEPGSIRIATRSGYEIFGFKNPYPDYIWKGRLDIHKRGKMGFLFQANRDADGYYLSIDPVYGTIQLRAWAARPEDIHKDYQFENLQVSSVTGLGGEPFDFSLLHYGYYIEFSINGIVKLSLIDAKFDGKFIGLYCDSAVVELRNSELQELKDSEEDELSQQFDANAGDWKGTAQGM